MSTIIGYSLVLMVWLHVDLKYINFQLLYLVNHISCCNEIFGIYCVNILIHSARSFDREHLSSGLFLLVYPSTLIVSFMVVRYITAITSYH